MGEIGECVAQSKQLDRKGEKDELVWVAYQNQLPSCCNLPQTGLILEHIADLTVTHIHEHKRPPEGFPNCSQ